MKIALTIALLHFAVINLHAQSPVVALTSSYFTTSTSVGPYTNTPAPNSGTFNPCTSSLFNYSYSNGTNNTLKITGITTNGKSYAVAGVSAIIKLRRVDNPNVTGKRSIIFLESTVSPSVGCPVSGRFDFKSAYQDVMEIFLNNTIINQGTDNVFTNASNSDGNNNNIERLDFIIPAGVASVSAPDAGFALFDRGVNNAHDPFRIAAITSLDANGDPASYGILKNCIGGNGANNGSYGHPTLFNGNKDLSVYVLRKEEAELRLRSSAAINQQLGGVFFSFADLGIPANKKIYGYSLLGPDGLSNPTSAQMLNINDATIYPTNTTEAVGGGLDLVAINAVFTSGPVLPVMNADLTSLESNGNLLVKWSVINAESQSLLDLEESVNGTDFIPVYSSVLNNPKEQGVYNNYNSGNYYYRMKITLPNGTIYYSKIIMHQLNNTNNSVKIYPTLLNNGQIIKIEGLEDDLYQLILSSADGKQMSYSLIIQNGSGSFKLPDNNISKGIYFLNFISKNTKLPAVAKIIIR